MDKAISMIRNSILRRGWISLLLVLAMLTESAAPALAAIQENIPAPVAITPKLFLPGPRLSTSLTEWWWETPPALPIVAEPVDGFGAIVYQSPLTMTTEGISVTAGHKYAIYADSKPFSISTNVDVKLISPDEERTCGFFQLGQNGEDCQSNTIDPLVAGANSHFSMVPNMQDEPVKGSIGLIDLSVPPLGTLAVGDGGDLPLNNLYLKQNHLYRLQVDSTALFLITFTTQMVGVLEDPEDVFSREVSGPRTTVDKFFYMPQGSTVGIDYQYGYSSVPTPTLQYTLTDMGLLDVDAFIAATRGIPEDPCLANNPQNAAMDGDPVNARTGNFSMQVADYQIPAPGLGLAFERSYNSVQADKNSPIGYGWTHNYSVSLLEGTDGWTMLAPHGAELFFTKNSDGTFTPDPGIRAGLMLSGTFYKVGRGDGINYIFNGTQQNGLHRLEWMEDRNGNRLDLTYNGAGKLSEVRPSGSDYYLAFEYSGNYLFRVRDHTGRGYQYGYSAAGDLTSVTDLMGYTTVYTYVTTTHRLADIQEPGATGATLHNVYDAQGRVIHQTDGAETRNYAYAADRTVVTKGTPPGWVALVGIYYFDGANAVRAHEDPLGRRITYTYDENYNLIAVTDPTGHSTRMAWDANSCQMTAITDTYGQATQMQYTGRNLTRLTDARQYSTTFAYNSKDQLVQAVNALGLTSTLAYNERGQLTEIVDPAGGRTRYGYDPNTGALISVTNALTQTATFNYDAYGRVIRVTEPGGAHYTQLDYNLNGWVTGVWDSQLGRTLQITYSPAGRPITMTDRAGRSMVMGYDNAGRLISVSRLISGTQLTQTTYYDYDGMDRVWRIRAPMDRTILYDYDAAGRVITVTDPELGETAYTYDLLDNVTKVTDPTGRWTAFGYDALGQVVTVTDGLGRSLWYRYDAVGNLITATDATSVTYVTRYDGLNRPVQMWGKGKTLELSIGQIAYDDLHRKMTVSDAAMPANVTEYTFDALGRLEQVQEPTVPEPTRYVYDTLGRVTEIINALEASSVYTYNLAGQLTAARDPLGGVTSYTYDPAGNVATITDADANVLQLSYDPLDQLTGILGPDVAIGYSYDLAGNRTMMTDTSGVTTTYSYNQLGWPTRIAWSSGEAVAYGYDKAGNRTGLTVTAGLPALTTTTWYSYNNATELVTTTDWSGQTTTYRYDVAGRPTTVTWANGMQTKYGYDEIGRPNEVKHLGVDQRVTDYQYEINALGNRVAVTEATFSARTYIPIVIRQVSGGSGGMAAPSTEESEVGVFDSPIETPELPGALVSPIEPPAETEIVAAESDTDEATESAGLAALPTMMLLQSLGTGLTPITSPTGTLVIRYTYDGRDQLTGTTYSGSRPFPVTSQAYKYSKVGNREELVARAGGITVTTAYSYNLGSRLTHANTKNYSYDQRGNLLTDGTFTYTYNSLSQMIRAESLTRTVVYTYNGNGLRVAQQISGEEALHFTWDEALGLPQVLATSDGTRYLYGQGLEGVQTDGDWYYPMADLLGTVRQWSNGDRQVVATADYDPFGVLVQSQGTRPAPLGYTGEWEDEATGLQYLRARWYSPAVGRFTQTDPFGGLAGSALTQNPYIYGLNSPTLYSDPTGQFAQVGIGAGVGALVGGGFSAASYILSHPGVSVGDLMKKPGFWRATLTGAAVGAVAGAAAGLVPTALPALATAAKTSLVASAGLGALSGAAAGGAGQVVSNLINGCPWNQGVLEAMAAGAFFGALAGAAEFGLRQLLQKLGPQLARVGQYLKDKLSSLGCKNGVCPICPCFPAETTVTVISGTVGIETIQVGDRVLAKDPETGRTGYYTVTALISHTETSMVQLKIGADIISATLEHPFRVAGRGWVEAGKLKVGDCIESTGKECQPVTEKQLVQGPVVVYNFTVQSAHTYFVGDGKWWVHNKCIRAWYQKFGGMSDSYSKGFHVGSDLGEYLLSPQRLKNGTIEIGLIGVEKSPMDNRVLSAVQKLLSEDSAGGIKFAEGIIRTFSYNAKNARIVDGARLIIEALENNAYTIVFK